MDSKPFEIHQGPVDSDICRNGVTREGLTWSGSVFGVEIEHALELIKAGKKPVILQLPGGWGKSSYVGQLIEEAIRKQGLQPLAISMENIAAEQEKLIKVRERDPQATVLLIDESEKIISPDTDMKRKAVQSLVPLLDKMRAILLMGGGERYPLAENMASALKQTYPTLQLDPGLIDIVPSLTSEQLRSLFSIFIRKSEEQVNHPIYLNALGTLAEYIPEHLRSRVSPRLWKNILAYLWNIYRNFVTEAPLLSDTKLDWFHFQVAETIKQNARSPVLLACLDHNSFLRGVKEGEIGVTEEKMATLKEWHESHPDLLETLRKFLRQQSFSKTYF